MYIEFGWIYHRCVHKYIRIMKGSIIASILGLIGSVTCVILLLHRASPGSVSDTTIRKLREEIERLKEQNKLLLSDFHRRDFDTNHTEDKIALQQPFSNSSNSTISRTGRSNRHVLKLAHSTRRSSHTCFGRTYNDDYWIENTCLYNNLVYDPATDIFTYVSASQAEATAVKTSGDLVVSTYPNGYGGSQKRVMSEGKLDPEVVSLQQFVKQHEGRSSVEVENVHVLYESYNAENFGHFLTDELLPVYSAMSAFRVVDTEVQLLRRQTVAKYIYSCDWQIANWGVKQKEKCDHNYKEFTFLLSPHPVAELRNYSRDLQLLFGNASDTSPFAAKLRVPTISQTTISSITSTPNTNVTGSLPSSTVPAPSSSAPARNTTKPAARGPLIVFRTLLSGAGMLADHCEDPTRHGRAMGAPGRDVHHTCNRNRQETLYSFREHTMRMAGVSTSAPTVNQVIIWDRHVDDYKSERKIYGLPELKARIEKEYGVRVILYEQWRGVSATKQIETMANSTVFITGIGSGSHIGWYLPRGGTMIRLSPAFGLHASHLEWHLFNYMPHFQVKYVTAKKGKFEEDHLMMLVRAALDRYTLFHHRD
eukprot:m.537358 g.537358  ORF g.537358 m.537358 type:complete len:592 (+) comp22076_c0_seq4:179-1954(+)